ncbi:hypothetical protein [Cognatilysobacter bugurensis]|uniref:Uncharacterized protein n=1 Tax=Cognatilysobacter bugurensis TaxID=543356 RepID=A0A918T1V1_9GAMM|nr:hypothetical protein [Lysobacter bugurensis]GHA81669.1 hypothetical protein GCM10007067_19420 [Lysobacter bugurensis]
MPLRLLRVVMLSLLAVFALVGCGSTPKTTQRDRLDALQYTWSAAIRWGDFEGAVQLLDPKQADTATPTALELERYKQVQISGYRDLGESRNIDAGTAVREIEIGVINRHTQAERTVRYRETWRWDPDAKTWWVTSGLPDLWAGQ